jgi:hypothetical protein
VTFFRLVQSPKSSPVDGLAVVPAIPEGPIPGRPLSLSTELLSGGGKANGEDPGNPFLREYTCPAYTQINLDACTSV